MTMSDEPPSLPMVLDLDEDTLVELPLLPIRDSVVFPHILTPLSIGRERSLKAVEAAMAGGRTIVIVSQKDPAQDEVTSEDLYMIGTEASITRMLKMPDGTTNILVQGERRALIQEILEEEPYIRVKILPYEDPVEKELKTEALMRAVLALFEKVINLGGNVPEDALVAAMNTSEPGWLADLVVSSLMVDISLRQTVLDALEPEERLQKLSILLAKEIDVLELQNKIHSEVQQEVDKSQREYILREQMKAIQRELGDSDGYGRDLNSLREKIESAGMPEDIEKKAREELDRLSIMPQASPEVPVIRTYLDWLIRLPWAIETEDCLDVKRAACILDENHYGLDKVKERIIEYLAVRKLSGGTIKGPILCFVGPPGVGKTSLGKSIAQAIGRKFVRISLGGIRDEAEIRGHRRTYVGALPGRIIQAMRNVGSANPVFVLDEIDKIGQDFRGDPSSALLEVLDPEQNNAFSDHYLDVAFDLSKVMFIATANILETIPPALQDRMEVINIPGYIEEEKLKIAERFLVPKQIRENGLVGRHLSYSRGALRRIIREYTREAGVRNLEREIGSICRKIARSTAEGQKARGTVSTDAVVRYLGSQKFFWGTAEEKDEVGVATGVAWTEMGGDVMGVEVALFEGKGSLTLTGKLGDVMKESAQAALSYAKFKSADFGIKAKVFDKVDVHIHVPAGAVPKDGPSAGVTMATALLSALTRRPVRRDVAMTGEITLRGRVLPVGGLKEKILAAHRAGLTTFILPKRNEKDLRDVPSDVKRDLIFVYAERMDEIIGVALTEKSVS